MSVEHLPVFTKALADASAAALREASESLLLICNGDWRVGRVQTHAGSHAGAAGEAPSREEMVECVVAAITSSGPQMLAASLRFGRIA